MRDVPAPRIPRDAQDDFTAEAAAARRAFIEEQTGATLDHVGRGATLDPATLPGNVEHFTGVAQVPIGLAGPLLVDGEHAKGEFYVPMATTEGTLVASYNRGMKLLRAAGGVRTTIVEDHMQRAPVFRFPSARDARDFALWLDGRLDDLREAASTTTSTGRLVEVERYLTGRFCFTRFDYTSGDAAGQNMTGKATRAACEWVREHYDGLDPAEWDYTLEGNLATDKKHSHMNTLRTRGKRVVAEALLPGAALRDLMSVSAEALYRTRAVSTLGGQLSGVVNNGSHSANALAAIFIATGQDAANVAESHAAMVYVELRDGQDPEAGPDLYYSITIPSLIVATYGGGTGLATQRECLEMLGCVGEGKVRKFAEICAATVLCGELSLGSAIVADQWVDAHDRHGRNR